MTKTTWTSVPAGVLGLGGADVRPCLGDVRRSRDRAAPRPPLRRQGTGLPAGGTAVRLRRRRPAAGTADAARRRTDVHPPRTTAPPSGSTPRADR